MDTDQRFQRMAEVEAVTQELVERGWKVKRVLYDDEENEDFHATVTITTDGKDPKDGVL